MVPLLRWDDPRNQVEREDALGPLRIAIHVEGDAHLQEEPLGRMFVSEQMAVREPLDGLDQEACVRPRTPIVVEYFVVEPVGGVRPELHGRPLPIVRRPLMKTETDLFYSADSVFRSRESARGGYGQFADLV